MVTDRNSVGTDGRVGKPILEALAGRIPRRQPVWLMRQAGRYLPEYREVRGRVGDFLELCYSPKLAAEVTLQPLRRYDLDAAIVFADILLIPDALGQSVSFKEGEGPVLEPVRDAAGLAKLGCGRLHEKLGPVYETISMVSKELAHHVALIGFAGAPWTVATYMVGGAGSPDQAAAKKWAYEEPESFRNLMDLLVEATVEYLVAQVNAGAEVLQIFDTWAGGLPPRHFERWCIQPTAEIVRRVRSRAGEVPIIGFPRGAGPSYVSYVAATGVNGIGIDTAVPAAWVSQNIPADIATQGNLDPLILAAGGDMLRTETNAILDGFAGRPHIFNLGHGIVPQTPPENVSELVRMIRARDQ